MASGIFRIAFKRVNTELRADPRFKQVEADARASQAAVQLALAQKVVMSQLVDNLNASIHLRALLTDLFLIDEALKGHQ